jgi:tetratricopeptide (TPR) repeat protein/transcriptional regulator with XRE-family HTH domain
MPKRSEQHPNQHLREARLHLGWTQQELADRLSTTALTIGRWERQEMFPSSYFRHKLCMLFGKSAEELGFVSPEKDKSQETVHNVDHQDTNSTVPSSSLRLWTLPQQRNTFFTGRDALLSHLHRVLCTDKAATVTQVHAMSGLGGIGKTQTAIEYAYRFRDEYQAVFWLRAETYDALMVDIVALAELLKLPEKDEQDQSIILKAVKKWLEKSSHWLLILDNVEDFAMLVDFLPSQSMGHILLTTRVQATGTLADRINVEQMEPDEGALFLLRRAKLLAHDATLDEASRSLQVQAKDISQMLDGLPLALDQAGAYIEETGCSLTAYGNRYQARRAMLLDRRGSTSIEHPQSVTTTLSLCIEKVEQSSSVAAELLYACAFLFPDAIPEEIITQGNAELGPCLQSIGADPLVFDEALAVLGKYSLLRRNAGMETLSIHRLVQVMLRERMDKKTQRDWSQRIIRAVNKLFPDGEQAALWPQCQRLLPHVEVCVQLLEQWELAFQEAGRLLSEAGTYLRERGQHAQAEIFLCRVHEMRVRILGSEHPDVAQCLDDLASLYWYQGRYAEAETFYRRALKLKELHLSPEHLDIAETLNNLAVLYFHQGLYTEAEPLYQRALSIKELHLGMEHPKTADTLNNLAVLYRNQGRYNEAEQLYCRTLVIWERQLGSEHPDTIFAIANLGRLYCVQRRYAEAEPLLQKAIALSERVMGTEHPSTAQCLSNLARLYIDQAMYTEAEPLLLRALTIREQRLGTEHPYTLLSLNTLAMLYTHQSRYTEATSLYERVIALQESKLGAEHPDVATSLHDLAVLYTKQAEYGRAKPLFEHTLVIRESKLGTEHPDTIVSRERYLELLQTMKQERID